MSSVTGFSELKLRSGSRLAGLPRRGFALLKGPRGYLYSVEVLAGGQPYKMDQPFEAAGRPGILFGLAFRFLALALQSIVSQAKVSPDTKPYHGRRASRLPGA